MSVNGELPDTVSPVSPDELAPTPATAREDLTAVPVQETGPDTADESSDELAAMASALERFHGRAEQYESIIRRMQTRIEELQADQVRELLKPVVLKLASLHTDAAAAEDRASTREDDSARKDFDYFVSEIEETLSLLDIESIGASALDEFDAARHAARRRIDTDDASLDRRIAKVLRQGFTFVGAERVFVPAVVTVFRHQPANHDETASAAETPETAN